MRTWWMVLALVATACGGQEASSQEAAAPRGAEVAAAEQHGQRAVQAILAGDRETWGPAVCDLLRSGIVSEVLEVEEAAVSYRPGSKSIPHPLCTATVGQTEVGLTVTNLTFDSPAAAVASLEAAVAQLEEGITITVRGRERTTQVDFDDWLDGVGDKAAWAPRWNELSVAAGGARFAVAVRGFGDGEANRGKAIAIAQRVAAAL